MKVDLVSIGLVCADVVVRPVDELPEKGKLALVPHLEMHMGGLAGVTAATFAQLGGKAAFMGRVGQDGFGDFLCQALEKKGVDVSHVVRAAGEGSASSIVVVDGDGERSFLHHTGAAAKFTDADVDMDVVAQAKIAHWGGPAVTPGLEGEPIGRVFEQARAKGVATSMDTCYDGKGRWFPLIEHALPHCDIVMSSIEEARQYTGCQTPEEIADKYRSYGPRVALIKLGGEGMYVKSENEELQVPAHAVEPVDSTGAGDAACGAFLYGWSQGWDVERSARLANAVGALTVQAMGGAEGVQSLSQAEALMEQLPTV
jgi:sugar/nucleoside kinase (ribokinase family)